MSAVTRSMYVLHVRWLLGDRWSDLASSEIALLPRNFCLSRNAPFIERKLLRKTLETRAEPGSVHAWPHCSRHWTRSSLIDCIRGYRAHGTRYPAASVYNYGTADRHCNSGVSVTPYWRRRPFCCVLIDTKMHLQRLRAIAYATRRQLQRLQPQAILKRKNS